MRLDAQSVLEKGQIGVEFAEKLGEETVVLERDDHSLARNLGFSHSPSTYGRLTARYCQSPRLLRPGKPNRGPLPVSPA